MRDRHLLAAIGTLALSACAAGPAPQVATPAPVMPDRFTYAPDVTSTVALEALLPTADPGFAELARQALAASPTLGEAAARIEQARAGTDRAAAERLPAIGASASVTASRTNPAQFGAALPAGVAIDAERVSYGANLTASWDPDAFGRLRAQERAALARLDAADASSRAMRLVLIAEIAASVVDWRTLAARERALRDDLAAAENLARLSEMRERAGLAPGFDRVRAESSAAASRSRLAALESERTRLVGRLVTLTAQDAGQIRAALSLEPPRSVAPVGAPASLPSRLLQNRPDVAAAAANLAAQDAELAATARRRFPVFDLSATVGLLAFGLGNLFDADSVVGSLATSVAAPLLDFGRIQAEIDGAAAGKKLAFEAYRGAVYTALGDAEAAYGLVAASDAEAQAAEQESASLRRAASLAEMRQRAGLADFLTVLEARRAADASGDRAAAAFGRAQRARVLLWQALGGSAWQPTR